MLKLVCGFIVLAFVLEFVKAQYRQLDYGAYGLRNKVQHPLSGYDSPHDANKAVALQRKRFEVPSRHGVNFEAGGDRKAAIRRKSQKLNAPFRNTNFAVDQNIAQSSPFYRLSNEIKRAEVSGRRRAASSLNGILPEDESPYSRMDQAVANDFNGWSQSASRRMNNHSVNKKNRGFFNFDDLVA